MNRNVESNVSPVSDLNFVHQQGFPDANILACAYQYPALMFQPRLLLFFSAIAIGVQSVQLFFLFGLVLAWNSIMPGWNPFDSVYNILIARVRNLPDLAPSPPPRRFAQAMGASFMAIIGVSILAGWQGIAWTFEGLLLGALTALVFGKFCLGSYLFHLLRGQFKFANRTLPWAKTDQADVF